MEQQTADILDLIGYGQENAITLDELEYISGVPERQIRRAIAESKDLIINMQDGNGYFRPTAGEEEVVNGWINIFRSRIREENRRIQQGKLWLRKSNKG